MRAPPDGYTLLIVGATNAVNATPYAPEVGFACGLTAPGSPQRSPTGQVGTEPLEKTPAIEFYQAMTA